MENCDKSDPFGLLYKKVPSSHCEGRIAEIIAYDHNWWQQALCDCGEMYIHDQGVAEPFFLSATDEEILESIKRVDDIKLRIKELEFSRRK